MNKQTLKKAFLVLILALFLGLSSQITIPLGFVPITGQTLAVGLIASVFGLSIGIQSLSLYILMGIAGLPFFAGAHAGLAVVLGPTGGYIWGFLLYILLVKLITKKSRSTLQIGLANASAALVQLFIGAAWLMLVTGITPAAAIANGVLPFIVPGLIKITMIVIVAKTVSSRVPVLYR